MIAYNVPTDRIGAVKDRNLIVRSPDPNELAEALSVSDLTRLRSARLECSEKDPSALTSSLLETPLELVLRDPVAESPLLYRYVDFAKIVPVRVIVPVEAAGFANAVKVALSLGLAVKLETGQPDDGVLTELAEVLDYYLHSAMAASPVDFFHGLCMAFYTGQPITLWDIQEEDPASFQFVRDDGVVEFSQRIPKPHRLEEARAFLVRLKKALIQEGGECSGCDFFQYCLGYFKMPDPHFSCDGITRLLGIIRSAATELKRDVAHLIGSGLVETRAADALFSTEESILSEPFSGPVWDHETGSTTGLEIGSQTSPERAFGVIFCTFECNNNCLFCAAADQKGRNPPDLDKWVFDFISKCAREGFDSILLSGAGEPTLNPSLVAYVRFARQNGISNLWLTTNGSNLNEEMLPRLVEAGITRLCISLHGIGDVHDTLVQRKGSYDEAMKAIDLVNRTGLTELDVNTCLTTHNLKRLELLIQEVASFKHVNAHILSQPELEGAAFENMEIVCRLKTLKEHFRSLNGDRYPHVILENVPYCVAPHLPHRSNNEALLLLREDGFERYVSSLNNVGHNRFPEKCVFPQCRYHSLCCGLDAVYLNEYGDEELENNPGERPLSG